MNVHSLSNLLPHFWGAQAASLSHSAACRMHFCSGVRFGSAGSRQAAANYRPAACAPQITLSTAHHSPGPAGATDIESQLVR